MRFVADTRKRKMERARHKQDRVGRVIRVSGEYVFYGCRLVLDHGGN